VTSVE